MMHPRIDKLRDHMINLAGFAISLLIGLFGHRTRNHGKKVLVVRIDLIGDFVLWQHAARYFKQIYPGHRIVLLANQSWSALAERLPYWDDIWPIDRERFKTDLIYRLAIIRNIRQAGFTVVIAPNFHRSADAMCTDSIIAACGARERIGSRAEQNTPFLDRRLLDLVMRHFYSRLLDTKSESQAMGHNYAFVSLLMGRKVPDEPPAIAINPPRVHVDGRSPYFLICPGAGKAQRRWPAENFAKIAGRIMDRTPWKGVICGGKAEMHLAAGISKGCSRALIDVTGKTSLLEMAGLINDARLVIGNETSPIHLAAAYQKKSVCILGGGHFGRFLPYPSEDHWNDRTLPIPVFTYKNCFHCDWKCIYRVPAGSPFPCIGDISVEAVWEAIDPLLPPRTFSAGKCSDLPRS